MFEFVLQKVLNKKWMMVSLLIGNLLLISIVCASPIYADAILQRTLLRNLNDSMIETNVYPGRVTMGINITRGEKSNADYGVYLEEKAAKVASDFGLSEVYRTPSYYLNSLPAVPEVERSVKDERSVQLGFLSDMESHLNMMSGERFTDELEPDGSIGVIVSQTMLIKQDLLVGERYTLRTLKDANGKPYVVTIKGVFEGKDEQDSYWTTMPANYQKRFFMSETLFRKFFVNFEKQEYLMRVEWNVLLDYTEMKGKDADRLLQVYTSYKEEMAANKDLHFSTAFNQILFDYGVQAKKLNVTLWVLQVPIFILLAAFIFMVSRQMLEMEQSEIAIFKSRGASKRQILSVYLMQSSFISVVSLVLGIPLGLLLCQVLGASNAFLEFVNRTSLPMAINSNAIVFALVATVFSIVTMVLPVLKYANVGIVAAKRKKQQKFKASWWEKSFLDLILVGLSLYGWYSFNGQKELLAKKVTDGASLDPLLFLSSSLFIIGAALLALRVFPWLVRLIFAAGRRRWSPSLYVSFRRVLAAQDNQGFIMVFLILTISLGIFNSMSARTINSNGEDRIRYNNGADVVAQEVWRSNAGSVANDPTSTLKLVYDEPDFSRYRDIEGVESLTKVLVNDDISISAGEEKLQNVSLMGIHTKEFGETAWFKDGLLPSHWYEYLNAMSQNPEAVLVSKNAQKEAGLKIGDSIIYRDQKTGQSMRGIIYAFVDHWPGYNAMSKVEAVDGTMKEVNHYLVVAHLQQLQANWGVTPYQVWMKMTDSSQPVYDFAAKEAITFGTFKDTFSDVIKQKNDPVFQGTNGVLTVGFIVVLALCTVGFLIYWILSIRSRQLQFGIFRAMGMSMKEILVMLVMEQISISGFAILIGGVVGVVASELFVPLIEITYATSEQSIPIQIVSNLGDGIRIFVVIGIMMAACMTVLGVMISKLKIAQALKLGED